MSPTRFETARIRHDLEAVVHAAPMPIEWEHLTITRDGSNPQTNDDLIAHEFLSRELPKVYPEPILSEEGNHRVPDDRPRWNIDPRDGTINIIAAGDSGSTGLYYATSAALQDRKGKSLVGAVEVRSGVIRDLFSAVADGGAFWNDRPLFIPGFDRPPPPRLVAFGYAGERSKDLTVRALHRAMKCDWDTVQLGSAATEICLTAGRLRSGFFEFGLRSWDFAAALLIAKEAGCVARVIPTGELETYDLLVATDRKTLRELAKITGITRTAALKRHVVSFLTKMGIGQPSPISVTT